MCISWKLITAKSTALTKAQKVPTFLIALHESTKRRKSYYIVIHKYLVNMPCLHHSYCWKLCCKFSIFPNWLLSWLPLLWCCSRLANKKYMWKFLRHKATKIDAVLKLSDFSFLRDSLKVVQSWRVYLFNGLIASVLRRAISTVFTLWHKKWSYVKQNPMGQPLN